MNTAAKLLVLAAAPLGAAGATCDIWAKHPATYHVLDSGLGQPVDEYLNRWSPSNASYVVSFMNGTVQQTGTCTFKDGDDSACESVCTAVGPGIPGGTVASIRSYGLPEGAGGCRTRPGHRKRQHATRKDRRQRR